MPKTFYPARIYAALLPLLIVTGFIALRTLPFQREECFGLVEALGVLFGFMVLIGLFVIVIIVNLVRMAKFPAWKHRLVTLALAALIGLAGCWLLTTPPGYFRANIILEATTGDFIPDAQLLLHEDETYSAIENYADWSCRYSGTFEWHSDTLILTHLPETHRFCTAWLINGRFLLPLSPPGSDQAEIHALELSANTRLAEQHRP